MTRLTLTLTSLVIVTLGPSREAVAACPSCGSGFARDTVALADRGFRIGGIDVIDQRLGRAATAITFRLVMVRGHESRAVELDISAGGIGVVARRTYIGARPLADKVYPNASNVISLLRRAAPTGLRYTSAGYALVAGRREVIADPGAFYIVEKRAHGAKAARTLSSWIATSLDEGLDVVMARAVGPRSVELVFTGRADRILAVTLDRKRRVRSVERRWTRTVVPSDVLSDAARARLRAWLQGSPEIYGVRADPAKLTLTGRGSHTLPRGDFLPPAGCDC